MAKPFPSNSPFPSLIDFEDEINEVVPIESWKTSLNADDDRRGLKAEHYRMVRDKLSSSRAHPSASDSRSSLGSFGSSSHPVASDLRSFELEFRDGPVRSEQNVGHVECGNREEYRIPHEEGTAAFRLPQNTLDLFLSSPHPNFHSPLPGTYDNGEPSHPPASHVSPVEKAPLRSDHKKPPTASSSCSIIPDDQAIGQDFPPITPQLEPVESPQSNLGQVHITEDGVSVSDEALWEESLVEAEMIEDEVKDSRGRGKSPNRILLHRKTYSYGQQWDSEMMQQGKRNALRKHSLDERLPKHLNLLYQSHEGSRFGEEMYPVSEDRDEFMSRYLERGAAEYSDSQILPEFIGSGGGNGIFKVPVRAAMHPGRPPPVELRPHPMRETQTGRFLRTITSTDSQLWAGQECGVRFWNLSDIFSTGNVGCHPKGDEETAPCYESAVTSPTLCLFLDAANRLIWTGHKDGRIRSWNMDQALDGNPFKEGLMWQAHRGPVLSMVMSFYGDLWSGSEGGVVKAWPWEGIEKSLCLSAEERFMASLLMERSCIDLRSQVTVNGVCCIPSSDVRYLLSDNCKSKVWSGGYSSFALWDARTRDLLKVFGSDGQAEIRADLLAAQDAPVEDEMKVKFVTTSKKEGTKGSLSFFQRSRNALMGAADAVRRAAAKGPFLDDSRRTGALITSIDGMIWTGCANGSVVQWDSNGNRLQEIHHHSFAVLCICSYGARLWVGYASGTIQVMDLDGKLLGGWLAHSRPVIKIAVGGGYVFTLAGHGGIRAWSLLSPGPIDNILRSELTKKELMHTKRETLKILTGTWNVGQERASQDSLISWLGTSTRDVGIVVVGLQEVEMGAGFLAMAAAKETVGLEGSANGQWWLDIIGKILDEGTTFERVGSRQLAGLLISVWVRKNLRPHVGDVDAAAVPCGFGRAIGNKGAVGLKVRVYHRKICFVNCHFAAHLEAVNRRNADFDHVYRTMVFTRPPNGINAVSSQLLRGVNVSGVQYDDGKPELCEADMIIFLGDFNYRLHGISYDEARDFVSQRCFDWLRERDQLRAEMKAGKVFQGMREGQIKFPPTYKFERHQAGLGGYDSGEKKRIPAWCDRILYRDSRASSTTEVSLQCPVISSILHYDACMDVTDSDHKPVRCIFTVDIAHVDEWLRRREFEDIISSNEKIRSLLEELQLVPETAVSTNNIILQNQDISILRLTNKCGKNKAMFEIICEGQSTIKDHHLGSQHYSRGSFGFPRWLEVAPATGIIKPGQILEVSIHHEEFHTLEEFVDGIPQNWWCEDTRDKEVIMAVNVRGSCSTEIRSHRIRVRHCFSSKTTHVDLKDGSSNRGKSNHLHRSDFRCLGSSSNAANDLRRLQTP